jgi:hypothetical protein
MFIHLGLCVPFAHWVMNCVTTISFSILINGLSSSFFRLEIKITSPLFLSHLLFIDGILILCDETIRDVVKLKEIMDPYCTTTSVMINDRKSTISFVGIYEENNNYFPNTFLYNQIKLQMGSSDGVTHSPHTIHAINMVDRHPKAHSRMEDDHKCAQRKGGQLPHA